jgi:DNA polymerase-3 subunit alpha
VQYGHKLEMDVGCGVNPARLAEILKPYRQENGLPVSLRIAPQGIPCTMQLGDAWRVAPSDELRTALEMQLGAKEVAVEY